MFQTVRKVQLSTHSEYCHTLTITLKYLYPGLKSILKLKSGFQIETMLLHPDIYTVQKDLPFTSSLQQNQPQKSLEHPRLKFSETLSVICIQQVATSHLKHILFSQTWDSLQQKALKLPRLKFSEILSVQQRKVKKLQFHTWTLFLSNMRQFTAKSTAKGFGTSNTRIF